MPSDSRRFSRERRTILAMLEMYCHDRHKTQKSLCAECADLRAYVLERLERCPFKSDKPTCVKCLVHCYKPDMRERVREVMRYAGPRMLRHHPVLAILHLLDNRQTPRRKGR